MAETKLRPYHQAYCRVCDVPCGREGQGPAYASEDGKGWDCERHCSPILPTRK